MTQDASARSFRSALQDIPDTTGTFLPFVPDGLPLNIFVDGSCTDPTQPALRVATWAICVGDLQTDEFIPVGAGGVPGLYQTTLRGEICGAIAAFRFGLFKKQPFFVWTDNALVFDRVRQFASGKPAFKKSNNDHDMWNQLHRLVSQAITRGFFQTIIKVVSHQCPDGTLLVEDWARRGNDAADRIASMARWQLPASLLHASAYMSAQHAKRRQACHDLHEMLVQFGLRCVTNKQVVEKQDDSKWEEARVKQTETAHTVSLRDLTADVQISEPAKFGACLQPLHAWLLALTATPDGVPLWLSSYQLYVHFQCSTGADGFVYDPKEKLWRLADDHVHRNGYDFLKLSSSLQRETEKG
eukprot:s1210_g16.t1